MTQPELDEPLAAAARVVFPVRVSPTALANLETIAAARNMTRSGLARTYLKEGLERDLARLPNHTQSPK